MRKLIAVLLLAAFPWLAHAQTQPYVIDSMKAEIGKAATVKKKVELLGYLCRTLMNINLADADQYGEEMIRLAEGSRDRQLMVDAFMANGERYSYLAGRRDNIEKSIDYYTKALELSRQNKMDKQMVKAYLKLSEVTRYIPDAAKALDYCNQAYSYIGTLKDDSLTCQVHLEYGSVFLLKNDKLLALRNFMAALRIAEELKNNGLLRFGYIKLSTFYTDIEDYDKAIDYRVKVLEKLDQMKSGQAPFNRVQEMTQIGDLYALKKNYDMSMNYYEQALTVADQLKFEPIKALIYRSIINNYLADNQPQKALDYFNTHPALRDFLKTLNFGYFVDQSYGFIYMRLGKYDSAEYCYKRVAPFFENAVNVANQYSYNYQMGLLYSKKAETAKAIAYFLKAKDVADKIGRLDQMSDVSSQLDSLYRRQGNYQQALHFTSLNFQYKDSLEKLGRERDLMVVEVADEQQRQERIAKEKLELKQKRDNIQYMLITIGIAALFVIMVMMGMFRVSAATIKMIGFFTFLMFFEFIFLIFKKNIYAVTQGEPWKDLLFMILLAAILLPLHHWLEHRVIHYLTSHNRLTATGQGLVKRVLKRKKQEAK